MRLSLIMTFFLFAAEYALAQKDHSVKKDPWQSKEIWVAVPINRQLSHDKIDRLQQQADAADGNKDQEISIYGNEEGGKMLTEALIKRVDELQIILENLPLDHWKKVSTLVYLEEDVKQFTREISVSKQSPEYFKNLIQHFEDIYKLQDKNESVVEYINSHFSRALYGSLHMLKNDKPAIQAIYKNMVRVYPDEMSKKFHEFSGMEAASDLMAYIAPKKPNLILTYATSTSAERNAVRNCKDPLVQSIVQIADKAKQPLRAIVFLDDLHSGQMKLDEVNSYTGDNASYYRQLVKQRMKSNSMTKKVLDRECKLQALEYVRVMNELHDSPDPVRFKCIEPLSPREMYFLMVLCSDEIYTSTFVGTFNRMLLKMAPLKGDAFLKELNMDKFRTFIRMCAGYNKLDEYLKTIDVNDRNELMASFVDRIDKNAETDVEDAVDIADAIGSIDDPDLVDFLLARLKDNYERTYLEDNKRGLIIYFLLHTLTTSIINPDASSEELQSQLKIPPIANIPFQTLRDNTNTVVEQVYFFGDDDGISSYNNFMSYFKSDAWKIEKNEQWVTITSLKGNATKIYANLPLAEPKDEEAQNLLNAHLKQANIKPSVVIHRGHSYHLPTTLKNLNADNKVIILGSCGGYHNLSTILTSSEDAHIISSKQTGTMWVTDPILQSFNTRMVNGQDVNWIELWNEVGVQMKTPALQDKFNDYVPPHKNMGALFLKAFKIQLLEQGIQM